MENKKDVIKELTRGMMDLDSDRIKGYPRAMYIELLSTFDVETKEDIAIATSNFRVVEKLNTIASRLGIERAKQFAEFNKK